MGTATWQGGNLTLGANTVSDQQVASNAAISVDKLQHAYKPYSAFGQPIGGTPVNFEEIVYVATNNGVVRSFEALLNVVGAGPTSIAFDLLKNGVSILSAPITIASGVQVNRQIVTAAIASAAFIAGDVFSMRLTQSGNAGAQGPFATAGFSEVAGP